MTQSERLSFDDRRCVECEIERQACCLSCCHSGRRTIQAEGVVGIARAFLGAGARSVIASLWAINDSHLRVYEQFYEHLMTGKSTCNSLHQATKWMRESEKFCAVKNWASGFVLIGDDVSLNFNPS